jgi:integrase
MAELRAKTSTTPLAMELCILTATRSSEVLNAEWTEFDLDKAIWTIPATRMKAGHAHRIPLTERVIVILKTLTDTATTPYVFTGNDQARPLFNMAMAMQLRRMKRDTITVHGFRSTFRDWASEQISFPRETCEHALAHRISDKAEAAYRRGDQLEKRRLLMEAWAGFCEGTGDNKGVSLRST